MTSDTPQISFITGNTNKFLEASRLLSDLVQVAADLPEVQALDSETVIIAKLTSAAVELEGRLLVEDTALHCSGLGGLPGPLVKWFLDCLKPAGLYSQVAATGNMRAEARCVLGFRDKHGDHFFSSTQTGTLVAPRGGGFGWDSIFQPDGSEKTYGEMTPEEKQTCSMRAVACLQLVEYLRGSS